MDIFESLTSISSLSKMLVSCMVLYGASYLTTTRDKLATGKLDNVLNHGKDGIQLSKHHQLSEKASQGHTLVIAPTQVGKSTSIFIPNLLQDDLRGSIIVYDPSLEIYNTTAGYQKSIGRKIIIYNPLDTTSFEYNLLGQCKTESEVIQLTQTLLHNGILSVELSTGSKSSSSEWLQLSQNLLSACLLYEWENKGTIKHALRLITELDEEGRANVFVKAKQRCKNLYNAYLCGADASGMQSSIKGTISSYLSLFFENLAINKNSFNAEMLREQECIVYITYSEQDSFYLSPVMASLYTQLINHLIDAKGLPIWFMLDEFANLGSLTGFNLTISTCAKRKIGFILAIQSFNQLVQVYGKDNALTIWGNCKHKVALNSISDIETLRMLSDLCDEEEIIIEQDKKKVKTKKKLFTLGEIRRIQSGKCLILSENFQAILDDANYYKNNKKYLERCNDGNNAYGK